MFRGSLRSAARIPAAVPLTLLLLAGPGAHAQGASSLASDLMRRKLYGEAAALLEREIRERPEAESAAKLLMLGECCYLQGLYADARPWFAKALRYLPEGENRTVAEYRLVCTAYRLDDLQGALEKTDAFVAANPEDKRSGRLLLFKMKALAARGASAAKLLEATRADVARRAGAYGATADLAADKILTDFYLANGLRDKAVAGYMNIVNSFRQVSAEYAKENRAVPAALQEARDYAAMQLAQISLAADDKAEAVKWLGSIRFDVDLQRRARLSLAQVAYGDRDYRKAEQYLLDGGFLDTVPPGDLKSDMYLLLGFCAKRAKQPTLAEVMKYFSRVDPASPAYAQAQMGIADTTTRWRRLDLAVEAYEKARCSTAYEPEALAKLSELYLQLAEQEESEARREELLDLSAERLGLLTTKYAASPHARETGETAKALLARGRAVKTAVSDEDLIAQWEAVAKASPGSQEAARALISTARLQQKAVRHEKTGRFVKAPDFAACLATCNRLLDGTVYKGQGLAPELWQDFQAEALYYRAVCHVSSVGRETPPGETVRPVYVEAPGIAQALQDLERAAALAGNRQPDLERNIRLVQVEAMFKSDDEALRRKAEERFHALVEQYGTEVRLQKLAMDIAQWHQEQGHLVEAARLYEGVAARGGAELSQDDVVRVLFMAGKLYTRAAEDALAGPARRTYAVEVYPVPVVRLAGLIDTHEAFGKAVRVEWPAGELTAGRALGLLSRASGIPFVWSPRRDAGSVADYLERTRLTLETPGGTVREFLARILDLDRFRLAYDIGLTGGTPTLPPPAAPGEADPEAREASRAIEIYPAAAEQARYEPMTRPYGAWQTLHPGVTMMYTVVERLKAVAGTELRWAEGVRQEDVLAAEYDALPDLAPDRAHSCAAVLHALLAPRGLTWRVVPREVSDELYELAKGCFNQIRQIAPRSPWGEQSLFMLALNYYRREDYERMKIILQEYLKVFDSPDFENYHRACFWVGWVLEREKRWREAVRYYNRAAEEALLVCRPAPGEPLPGPEALKALLSYDTAFALEELVSGTLTNLSLTGSLQDVVRLHTGVEVAIAPDAMGATTNLDLGRVAPTPALTFLHDVLGRLSLTFRPKNRDEKTAEMAYYRMAVCYKNEGLDEQALAGTRCLLTRYPDTRRRGDAYKLQLEIYKALKDYRNVLETLAALRNELVAEGRAYTVDFEMAWIYMDLCRYEEAVRHFKEALAGARDPGEQVRIRDGYARALAAAGRHEDALAQYAVLVREESEPLRQFVAELMAWHLARVTGREQSDALPAAASELIRKYEELDDAQRARVSRDTLARVTWVYYVTGLHDARTGAADRAMDKLDAAGNSPDDWLAAHALLAVARLHADAGRFDAARESLEYLLFSTKSAEAELKALELLVTCLRATGDAAGAAARTERILARFPDSAQALAIQAEREAKQKEEAPGPAAEAPSPPGAAGPPPDARPEPPAEQS